MTLRVINNSEIEIPSLDISVSTKLERQGRSPVNANIIALRAALEGVESDRLGCNRRLPIEIAFVRVCTAAVDVSQDAIFHRFMIALLENARAG
jgi:hypothetical protein